MRPRHSPPPRFWLMTDERMGESLLPAVARLPKGRAGVVFRHYRTPPPQRRLLYEAVRQIARRNHLVLLLADKPARARRWRADGWHGPEPGRNARLIHSMAVHGADELATAIRARADFIFLSPVFPTRSHPAARALGPFGFNRIARRASMPVIALGGMTPERWQRMRPVGAYGYAAIDAWI